jgi:hypothetical protein
MNWPRLYSCTHEHLIYVFQVVRVYTENFILIVAVRRPLFSVNDCHLYLSSFDLTQRPATAHCARKTNSVNRRLINQKRILKKEHLVLHSKRFMFFTATGRSAAGEPKRLTKSRTSSFSSPIFFLDISLTAQTSKPEFYDFRFLSSIKKKRSRELCICLDLYL